MFFYHGDKMYVLSNRYNGFLELVIRVNSQTKDILITIPDTVLCQALKISF